MQLDPSRWLVSWAGFVYDWIITREWRRTLLCLLPAILLAGLAVAAGGWSDRAALSQHYLELGNREIAAWEQAWAPAMDESPMPESSVTEVAATEGTETEGPATPAQPQEPVEDVEEVKIPSFAEALFRRVQLLNPSDRSQFVIAVTLAQRGAFGQAKKMLSKIAPTSGRGYVPAHAMQAQLAIFELQNQPAPKSRQVAEQLIHHANQSKQWDRVPRAVLLAASDLNVMVGDIPAAAELLTISADRFPGDNFGLAQLAEPMLDEHLFEQSREKAEKNLLAELADDAQNTSARLRLAQLYTMGKEWKRDDLDRAEQLLLEVPEPERTAELQRALSVIDLKLYARNNDADFENGKESINFKYLKTALETDESNPLIAQEVAKLVRNPGQRPPEELIAHLLGRLADGSATPATHAYIAELYLVRQDYAKAIPHLEQVVKRLPNATEYFNNLAFCLAELHPERCEQALELSLRAIELSKLEPRSDYYDTLSFVLSRLDRHLDAVTAIESAIELDPNRPDYHTRAATEYRHLNNESMAANHERYAKQLLESPPVAKEPQDAVDSALESGLAPSDSVEPAQVVDSPAQEPDSSETDTVETDTSDQD